MAILKKQTFGSICTLLALILAVAGVVAYYMNIGAEGYFQGAAVSHASTLFTIAAVALALIVALNQVSLNKTVNKLFEILSGVLQIAAPAGLMAAAMYLVESRAQGLAYIYFSNEEVLAEVQTAANLSSASGAITAIALLAVAALVGIVAAFFRQKKA